MSTGQWLCLIADAFALGIIIGSTVATLLGYRRTERIVEKTLVDICVRPGRYIRFQPPVGDDTNDNR